MNAIPPVVSRFTLFVRETASPDEYNLLKTGANGSADPRPLTLLNGGSNDANENGWIYFGADRVNLNLARGEANFGEDFHLPDTLTRSLFFPCQEYVLLHLNVGFYRDAGSDAMFQKFPNADAFPASTLRLYGARAAGERAHPALVIGNVWRRYLQAAATGWLGDGDTVSSVVPLPWTLQRGDVPRTPGMPPFLYRSFRLYQLYMSQVREEPFNRSHDFIVSDGACPPPLLLKRAVKKELGNPYPLVEPEVDLKNYRGETVYAGRLKYFDMKPAIAPKGCVRAASLADLLAYYRVDRGDGPLLDLEGVYVVAGKAPADLAATGALRVRGRAMLVFEAGARLGELSLVDGTCHMVNCVALAGDLALTARKVQSGLSALAGRVIPCGGADVEGFLAADRLDGREAACGGVVTYDLRCRPHVDKFRDFYTLCLSPVVYGSRDE